MNNDQKKMDDCIYIIILYIFVIVNTHQRFRNVAYNINKKNQRENPTKIKKQHQQQKTET